MKITSVEVYEYRVDYAQGPLTMSHGRTATGQPSFVVRVPVLFGSASSE